MVYHFPFLEVEKEYSASTAVFFELQPRRLSLPLASLLAFLIQVCPRLQTLSIFITQRSLYAQTSAYTEFPAT